MKLYYRISDKGYAKNKLPGATKAVCIANFLNVFRGAGEIIVIADHCEDSTYAELKIAQEQEKFELQRTSLGNSGSMKFAINMACARMEDENEIIYFCEDDYLHREEAADILKEGPLVGDYFTLYDHPDKYRWPYIGGGETSIVRRTPNSHWRYTVSTCMTFGTTGKYLKLDRAVFDSFCGFAHPNDHHIFLDLKDRLYRKLALCIPGVACHTDLTVSGGANEVLIEGWAIDMMCDIINYKIEGACADKGLMNAYNAAIDKRGWQQLIRLAAIEGVLFPK